VKRPLPSKWLQEHFYIPEPRNPYTGDFSDEPGPIILHEMQGRLVDEALSTDDRGLYKYTTVIYSTIKKSGKSTLASGAGLYLIHHTPFSHGYCLANDGVQSEDILFGPVNTCITLHNKHGGIFKGVKAYSDNVKLKNNGTLESLPCDAAGNAGKEPTISLWSELWGFETPVKRKLFSEMTVPSTKFGRALRWIETYAGYSGTSLLLWDLYQQAVKQGQPHPDFRDISSGGEPVVWINEAAGIFCYWDHEPRMAWQLGDEGRRYYLQESRILESAEYNRLHHNLWISPIGSFIQPELWDACADKTLQPLNDDRTPMVVAIDAAETNDCACILGVTRHPVRFETDIAIRKCKIFKPGGPAGTILLEPTVGRTLLQWGLKYNIIVVCYDAYQLAKLTQDYSRGSLTFTPDELMEILQQINETASTPAEALEKYQRAVQRWYYRYSQQTERTIADKFLFDLIAHRRIAYNPDDLNEDIAARGDEETLTKHVKQAGAGGGKGQYRIQKLADTLKVDGAVALSMASELCLRLNLDGAASTEEELVEQVSRGRISYEEYLRQVQERINISHG
jgi:hypothetical protein